jgi:hypothetical protein
MRTMRLTQMRRRKRMTKKKIKFSIKRGRRKLLMEVENKLRENFGTKL